ncbi:MAG: hypothetical protein MZW92_49500 [Comamonadaceae bacterium]|nr:hypothetical protein [Comamonadaceae bacterium]
MGDREVDQAPGRARSARRQAGIRAFWCRSTSASSSRLLSRLIRDPAEVEDVTQEAFIKAYRALPSFRGDSAFYTWLYRIGVNTAKNYLVSQGRRAPTTTEFDSEEAEAFDEGEQLRDINTPEHVLLSKQIGETVNGRDGGAARGAADRDHAARDRRPVLRGNRHDHGLSDRHGALAGSSGRARRCPRGCGRCSIRVPDKRW